MRTSARAAVLAIAFGLSGCAITGADGTKAFGVFPIAAPEPKTVTIDKALTVAARIEVAGYGGIFFGFSSGVRARVPVLCLEDGRCFVPKLTTDTKATTSFQGGTTVVDGVSIDGFTAIPGPAEPAAP